jgi:hypothetical protein
MCGRLLAFLMLRGKEIRREAAAELVVSICQLTKLARLR